MPSLPWRLLSWLLGGRLVARAITRGLTQPAMAAPPPESLAEEIPPGYELVEVPPGWRILPKARLPRPTYWPPAMAAAFMFILWGIVTSWILTITGVVLLIFSIMGWTGDLIDELERKRRDSGG
jgi:hypothetical protein